MVWRLPELVKEKGSQVNGDITVDPFSISNISSSVVSLAKSSVLYSERASANYV